MTTTRNTTTDLTTTDITAGYEDERWLGWGYLQGRTNDEEIDAGADAYVLARAAERGWDREDLFHWMNSKDGRWFADWYFGGDKDREYPWVARLFPDHPAR